jgi:hypothetical protein
MSSRSPRPPSRPTQGRPTETNRSTGRVVTPDGRSRGRPVQKRRRPLWIWALAALGVVVLVVAGVLLSRRTSTANVALDNVTTYPNLARDHDETNLTYPQTPPVGGAHNPRWENCGIYDQPIQNEYGVHSLEHGAVWITYQPDLPTADVEKLRALVRGHKSILLTPYPGLPSKVVASAWGVQLKADGASDPHIAAFIAKYENGPQTPEPGAACSGGVGNPVDR